MSRDALIWLFCIVYGVLAFLELARVHRENAAEAKRNDEMIKRRAKR